MRGTSDELCAGEGDDEGMKTKNLYMQLVFVRHGKTDWGKAKKISGWEDIPLNEGGVAECEGLLPQLDGGFDIIYSSPLKRAAQSAEIFSRHLGVPVVHDPDLRERNFGSLMGKTWEQVLEEYGADMREIDVRQEYDYRPFGGESAQQVRERVERFARRAVQDGHARPLVVAHAGVIRMMQSLCLKKGEDSVGHNSLHTFDL